MTEESERIWRMLKEHREEILAIATRHGAGNVRVFGSVARGEAKPGSDVDLLVDMENGRSLLDLAGLLRETEEFFQRRVDVVTERSLSRYIREEVLRGVVPV
jgi:predicted nucleotidyltransferase